MKHKLCSKYNIQDSSLLPIKEVLAYW